MYICKNLFYLYVDTNSCFGDTTERLAFIPANYSVKESSIVNMWYRIANMPEEYREYVPEFKKKLEKLKTVADTEVTDIAVLLRSPIA